MDHEAKPQPETLQAACDDLVAAGMTYTAEFVPWSKSRNAKKPPVKPGDYSLNWKITLAKGRQSLTTDYTQGIAHIPGYSHQQRWTVDAFGALKFACEQGCLAGAFSLGSKPLPIPLLRDVLYCLISDANAIDVGTFEDWANEYGYAIDSRKAEKTYRTCIDLGLKLRAMLGDTELAKLREAAQDY